MPGGCPCSLLGCAVLSGGGGGGRGKKQERSRSRGAGSARLGVVGGWPPVDSPHSARQLKGGAGIQMLQSGPAETICTEPFHWHTEGCLCSTASAWAKLLQPQPNKKVGEPNALRLLCPPHGWCGNYRHRAMSSAHRLSSGLGRDVSKQPNHCALNCIRQRIVPVIRVFCWGQRGVLV